MKKKSKKSKPKAKAKKKLKIKARPKARAKARPKAKKAAKKVKAKKKSAPKKGALSVIPPPNSVLLGRVEDFYAQVGVIALTLQKPLRVGDRLNVLGHTTNIDQRVDSMQINHQAVQEAGPKDGVGIKVNGRSRRGDYVFVIKG
jgi:hypothetical protein